MFPRKTPRIKEKSSPPRETQRRNDLVGGKNSEGSGEKNPSDHLFLAQAGRKVPPRRKPKKGVHFSSQRKATVQSEVRRRGENPKSAVKLFKRCVAIFERLVGRFLEGTGRFANQGLWGVFSQARNRAKKNLQGIEEGAEKAKGDYQKDREKKLKAPTWDILCRERKRKEVGG